MGKREKGSIEVNFIPLFPSSPFNPDNLFNTPIIPSTPPVVEPTPRPPAPERGGSAGRSKPGG
jgi:hypothetical protein